ncbi:MAG: SulP family inorganic anion transporter [Planctomycetales bacterium]|nr:SulP family inorganic anion transporter [Planctomycetales bacterium]
MSQSPQSNPNATEISETPYGNAAGFARYLKYDIISGLLVFLIALPLCLAISMASGFPPVAGVFTAIVGAVLTTFLSNSELTIKGPAAGLIVIVLGAVQSFGHTGGQDPTADMKAYQMALAVAVVAGVVQILFGIVRAGILGDFFPTAAVHGMLAAIGCIIMLKQLPVAVGQSAKGEPFEILKELPDKIAHANPEIAIIGVVSLLILFGLPWLKSRFSKKSLIQVVPAQLIVVLVTIPLGIWFNLSEEHTYSWAGATYTLNDKFLVNVPNNLFSAIMHPDFSVFSNPELKGAAIKWVVMFALIGSLESMLSAKAIDMIDPWKRKTNLNRDLLAVGIANTIVAMIGGLPMISEIVRSKANIDNGARTRFADFWHGAFLLAFVALAPTLIHRIPTAALAAMLVYTGFRLASPKEFMNVYKIGIEQLVIFVTTIIAVLATDLLIGIAIGIATKFAIHLINGVPIQSFFKPFLEVQTRGDNTVVINAKGSAVFSNWIPFKRQIEQLGLVQKNNVIVDLSGTTLVDHSVMEKLHEMELDFHQAGLEFEVIGLDAHQQFSEHPYSARKKGMARIRRITVVTSSEIEKQLESAMVDMGATGFTCIPCRGVGRRGLAEGHVAEDQVRIEAVVPSEIAERILAYVRRNIAPEYPVTACIETVEVISREQFEPATLAETVTS